MIVLIGESGSGKDTILNMMVELGYKPIISYTTRPKRHYEIDGKDYHFITEEEFFKKQESGFFVETTCYNNWHYGIAYEDLNDDDSVVIVEPNGFRQLKSKVKNLDIKSVYVYASEETRLNRLCDRKDNPNEIARRIYTDRDLFKGIKDSTDYVFENDFISKDLLKDKVIKFIKSIRK